MLCCNRGLFFPRWSWLEDGVEVGEMSFCCTWPLRGPGWEHPIADKWSIRGGEILPKPSSLVATWVSSTRINLMALMGSHIYRQENDPRLVIANNTYHVISSVGLMFWRWIPWECDVTVLITVPRNTHTHTHFAFCAAVTVSCTLNLIHSCSADSWTQLFLK